MSDRAWKIIRDSALVVCGVFMLAHETLASSSPDPIIVGSALGLLGMPTTLRLDSRRRNGDSDGSPSDKEDK